MADGQPTVVRNGPWILDSRFPEHAFYEPHKEWRPRHPGVTSVLPTEPPANAQSDVPAATASTAPPALEPAPKPYDVEIEIQCGVDGFRLKHEKTMIVKCIAENCTHFCAEIIRGIADEYKLHIDVVQGTDYLGYKVMKSRAMKKTKSLLAHLLLLFQVLNPSTQYC